MYHTIHNTKIDRMYSSQQLLLLFCGLKSAHVEGSVNVVHDLYRTAYSAQVCCMIKQPQ
jgi:hypothetical protein